MRYPRNREVSSQFLEDANISVIDENTSLVDDITHSVLTGASNKATKTAILGPFYRVDTPPTPNDSSIIRSMPNDGEVVYMHGIVSDADSGAPIEGVLVDVWQCSTNGLYEQQDPEQAEWNLRGKLTTDSRGYYGHYCLRPVPYPIPYDGKQHRRGLQNKNANTRTKGPAGKLLQLLDKHPWRPGHIHILVSWISPSNSKLSMKGFKANA
jgi:catechol 1,2-dioxygenase